jgi:hypothetical protein
MQLAGKRAHHVRGTSSSGMGKSMVSTTRGPAPSAAMNLDVHRYPHLHRPARRGRRCVPVASICLLGILTVAAGFAAATSPRSSTPAAKAHAPHHATASSADEFNNRLVSLGHRQWSSPPPQPRRRPRRPH